MWLTSTSDGTEGTDSLSQGVFVLRRAPPTTANRRLHRQKGFLPLVPDEAPEACRARWDAYVRCWSATDAHVTRVLADANADAFSKLQGFVEARFGERVRMCRENGGAVPHHAAQQIPVGLVLAGGVNSDDHEETFAKLTTHLRESGCHTALIRSRDLKARGAAGLTLGVGVLGGAAAGGAPGAAGGSNAGGAEGAAAAPPGAAIPAMGGGGGGGGLGVAARCILSQLQAGTGGGGHAGTLRVSGRSVRHIKRWYQDVTLTSDDAAHDDNDNSNNDARGGPHGGTGGPHGVERENVNGVVPSSTEGDNATLRDSKMDVVEGPTLRARPAETHTVRDASGGVVAHKHVAPQPIVIVIEDTESFDHGVLSDLLLALSDAGDVLPVCVLLGVATSVAMMHGMIPAAVAARLRVESFHLWSPKSIMTAVQERVLLDPGRAPALSSKALELLMTRFKEHDYSLSAARRAMHLLTLDHFMTQPLSALAPVAVVAGEAYESAVAAGGGFHSTDDDDDDVEATAALAEAAARAADEAAAAAAREATHAWLSPQALRWAHRNLGQQKHNQPGRPWVSKFADVARDEIADAVAAGFASRRRWGLALRCVAAAAEAVGLKSEKGNLANLLVDASSVKWMVNTNQDEDETGGLGASNQGEGCQGESLLRLLCGRLECEEQTPPETLSTLCRRWLALVARDPDMYAAEGGRLRECLGFLLSDSVNKNRNRNRNRQADDAPREAVEAVDAPADPAAAPSDEKSKSALFSPGGNAAAVRAALVARRRGGPEQARALELAAAARGQRARGADVASTDDVATPPASTTGAHAWAADFLRRVARAYASRPPATLDAHEIFCVTTTACLRQAVEAAPRLTVEQTMATPRPVLRCECCPKVGGPDRSLPDTCAAYNLLQDLGDAANIHDWFRMFCELHEPKALKGTKGKQTRKSPDVTEASAQLDGKGTVLKETFHLDRQRLWELQARFTRAVAELEFLGVARPVKRRKVEYMQRTAFPLDKLLGLRGESSALD